MSSSSAQAASRVGDIPGVEQVSYSGFFTVNETTNSNMYFWFFPARVGHRAVNPFYRLMPWW